MRAFESFECALYEANETRNLTRVPREQCWLRHFVDSLLVAEFIPPNSRVLDIGTGPGFPAWPLAVVRPDLELTALDSNGKMLTFLASQPLANLTIVHGRAEDDPPREAFDIVTGRALAPLHIQLELSAAPCRIDGRVIPLRTPQDEPFDQPPPALGLRLVVVHRRVLPGTGTWRALPEYRKDRATGKRFPRRWAEIKASKG